MLLIYDTLSTRLLDGLQRSLGDTEEGHRLSRILERLRSSDRNIEEVYDTPDFRWMCGLICKYRTEQAEDSGDFQYYSQLLDAIGSVIHMWRCFRFPEYYGFEMKLEAMEAVMPLFFATGSHCVRSHNSLHRSAIA